MIKIIRIITDLNLFSLPDTALLLFINLLDLLRAHFLQKRLDEQALLVVLYLILCVLVVLQHSRFKQVCCVEALTSLALGLG